jgi:hypothetical protein
VLRSTLIALVFVSCSSMALAQPHAGTFYLAGRLGADVESTDPGSGTSTGIGGSIGFPFAGKWHLEIEGWVPRYISDVACPPGDVLARCGPGQFRDLLVAASMVRSFGQGVRPYVLVGAAKLWNQQIATRPDGSTVRWTRNESLYPQGGVGLEIPLSSHLALAPEVRFDVLFLGGILRPNVTLIYRLP